MANSWRDGEFGLQGFDDVNSSFDLLSQALNDDVPGNYTDIAIPGDASFGDIAIPSDESFTNISVSIPTYTDINKPSSNIYTDIAIPSDATYDDQGVNA